ncbi:MAG: patatin-like phospholipase family protein [Lachnospiraceae bacterium]|nr:patatin-like phospholipase family protein [Lachnospiraceae bacterium]
MCYYQIPETLNPYDHETFEKYQGDFFSVVTNIETGEPEYIPIKDLHTEIEAIRASASLPLVSRNVPFNGKLYLDGGISDGIPLKKSMEDGHTKNVVVMTKEKSPVGRIEKDVDKLTVLYEQGYRDASDCYEELLRFLEK